MNNLKVEKERIFRLEICVMDKNLFDQIQIPDLRSHELGDVEKDAAKNAVALAIDKNQEVWVIIRKAEGMYWRWQICPAENLQAVGQEHPWIGKLPQVFLVRQRYRKVKGAKK